MIIIMTEVQNFVTIIQSISEISMSKSGKTAKCAVGDGVVKGGRKARRSRPVRSGSI